MKDIQELYGIEENFSSNYTNGITMESTAEGKMFTDACNELFISYARKVFKMEVSIAPHRVRENKLQDSVEYLTSKCSERVEVFRKFMEEDFKALLGEDLGTGFRAMPTEQEVPIEALRHVPIVREQPLVQSNMNCGKYS